MSGAVVSRREFLKTGGALVVGFSLIPLLPEDAAAASGAALKPVALDRVESFLAIGADDSITCYSGKVDLGTGMRTALAQIVAEELTVPFEKVHLVMGDTLLTPDQGVTFGSLSIQNGGVQIRQASASARAALKAEAAKRWRVDARDLTTANGAVRMASGSRQISYGELVRGQQLALPVDAKAPLLDPAGYRIVGRSVPRVDIPGKVTGEFIFMQDFRVPGMVHARVVRPPAIGATLISVDDNSVVRHPRPDPRGARRQFPGRRCQERMEFNQGGARAQGHLVRVGGPAGRDEALGACACDEGGQGRRDEQRR